MTERVHVVHVFSTFEPGGPQVRTAELIARLPDRFEHSILAMDGRYGCRERVAPDRVRAWLDCDPGRGPLVPLRLARYVLAQRPDLVLTYNWGAIETVLGCRLRRFPHVIHHEDGFGPDEQERQKRRRVLFRRFVLRGTRTVIVPSRNLERIARDVWRVPDRLLRYVPNAIDLDGFRPAESRAARSRLGLPHDAVIIGSVGHLRPEKSYGVLLESFAALEDDRAWLVLAGDGPERAALEERAAVLGVAARVRFTGMIENVADVYAALDVFALSSATEQMPISVLEAMACGRAVVSTDVGDVAEMVSAENRPFVVPHAEHAAALARLVAAPEERARIASANREHCAATYPMTRMVDAYRELYDAARHRPS